MLKRCDKCRCEKSLTDFYKSSKRADGLQRRCKGCQRIDTRERMRKPHNSAKQLQRVKAWQDENRDRFNAYKSAWARRSYANDPQKWIAASNKYMERMRQELADSYVGRLIARQAGCKRSDVPEPLITAKRAHIAIKRLITEKSK